MTELIDEFHPRYAKGRGMAVALLVLTSVGGLLKLIVGGIATAVVVEAGQYMGKEGEFVALIILLIALLAIINIIASAMMLKQKRTGFVLYLISQLLTMGLALWAFLVINRRIRDEEYVGLAFIIGLPTLFTVLYYANRKYWKRRSTAESIEYKDDLEM